jgi:hypothetical protein
MNYFETEKAKEYGAIGYKNKRRNLRELPQKGTSNKEIDRTKHALLPGKRLSKTGKIYWETRVSRSDKKGSRI